MIHCHVVDGFLEDGFFGIYTYDTPNLVQVFLGLSSRILSSHVVVEWVTPAYNVTGESSPVSYDKNGSLFSQWGMYHVLTSIQSSPVWTVKKTGVYSQCEVVV